MSRRAGAAGLKEWLAFRWSQCERCGLADYRQSIVLGHIRPSPLVFIGEAPGRKEDEQGRPFVGVAGQKFQELALEGGINVRQATIINTLACRPPNNRDPRPEELKACSSRIYGTLRALRPYLVVTLGRVPSGWALGRSVAITSERGDVHNVFYPGAGMIQTLITLHPAYLLRNPNAAPEFVNDMRQCRELVAKKPIKSYNKRDRTPL